MFDQLFKKVCAKNKKIITLTILSTCIYYTLPFLPPLMLQRVYELLEQKNNITQSQLIIFLIGWISLSLCKIITEYAVSLSGLSLKKGIFQMISSSIASSEWRLPHEKTYTGEDISYTTFYDIDEINNYIYWIACIPSQFLLIFISLFPIIYINNMLLCISIAVTFTIIGLTAHQSKNLISHAREKTNKSLLDLSNELTSCTRAQKEYLSQASKINLAHAINNIYSQYSDNFLFEMQLNQLIELIFATISYCIQTIIIYLLSYKVTSGVMTIDVFILATSYISALSDTAYYFGCYFTRFYQAKASSERIIKTFNIINEQEKKTELPLLEKLHFLDKKNNTALLTVTPSKKVFLKGATPHSLSKFLQAIFSPEHNKDFYMVWNDKEINESETRDLSTRVIYCPQRVNLFPDTIKNIICCGVKNEDRLQEVLFITGLDEEIKHFHNGLETCLSIDKIPLSGGQQQRISLARSLFLQGDIYLLDHVTSSLDTESANRIWQRLFNTRKETFIIASQDETIKRYCDTHSIIN